MKPVRVAKIVVVVGCGGISGNCRSDQVFGLNIVAVLLRDDTEQMECLRMVGIDEENVAVARLGGDKIARFVEDQAPSREAW